MQSFVVRTGERTCSPTLRLFTEPMKQFTDSICIANRIPRQHKGWQSVTYKGKRYQLFGGVHVYWFICLNKPIKGK